MSTFDLVLLLVGGILFAVAGAGALVRAARVPAPANGTPWKADELTEAIDAGWVLAAGAVFVITCFFSGKESIGLWSLVAVVLFTAGVFAHRRRFNTAGLMIAGVVVLGAAVAAALA